MLKKALRIQFLERRKNLSPLELDARQSAICGHLCRLDLSAVKILHLFLPIEHKNEFNTWPLVRWLQEYQPDISLVVPRTGNSSGMLEHVLLLPSSIISLNKWGIPEPLTGDLIEPQKIDLCLVPLLAVDKKGQRVGYGGGYYDRFLADCRPDLRTVGVSLFEPIDEISDTGPFDIALRACLFPSGYHVF